MTKPRSRRSLLRRQGWCRAGARFGERDEPLIAQRLAGLWRRGRAAEAHRDAVSTVVGRLIVVRARALDVAPVAGPYVLRRPGAGCPRVVRGWWSVAAR